MATGVGAEPTSEAQELMSNVEARHMEAAAAKRTSFAIVALVDLAERVVVMIEKLVDTAEADKR